jgi:hypothetical protein
MTTWQRFRNLSRRERSAVLQAAAVMVGTRAGLRLAGLHRWKSILAKVSSLKPRYSQIIEGTTNQPARLARLSASTARALFFRATCLERSIGLWWILRQRGFDAEIHIGGRKDAARFEAHAWVECGGIVLGDTDDEHLHFVPFGETRSLTTARGTE